MLEFCSFCGDFMAKKLIIIHLTGDPVHFGEIKLKGENIP